MRTTLNLDGEAIAAAMKAAPGRTKTDVINDALRSAAILGRVILLGSPRGRVEIDPYTDIHRKGVAVIGASSALAAAARWEGNLDELRERTGR